MQRPKAKRGEMLKRQDQRLDDIQELVKQVLER